jgi:hypothetical protein
MSSLATTHKKTRYVDDTLYLLCPLTMLSGFFPTTIAEIIHQYSHLDRVSINLFQDLETYIADNAIPDLI